MAINNYEDMSSMQLDVLREVSNVGTGNAATALANMLGRSVDIGIPTINILEYSEIADKLGGAEEQVIGILIDLTGDINGMMLFLLRRDFAHVTINDLLGQSIGDFEELDEIGRSMLIEIGNIMAGSYMSAMSMFMGVETTVSTPSLSEDMLGSILSVPAIHFADISDKIIFIGDAFTVGDSKNANTMLLIPDMASLEKIMEKLGLAL